MNTVVCLYYIWLSEPSKASIVPQLNGTSQRSKRNLKNAHTSVDHGVKCLNVALRLKCMNKKNDASAKSLKETRV